MYGLDAEMLVGLAVDAVSALRDEQLVLRIVKRMSDILAVSINRAGNSADDVDLEGAWQQAVHVQRSSELATKRLEVQCVYM